MALNFDVTCGPLRKKVITSKASHLMLISLFHLKIIKDNGYKSFKYI